MQWVNSNIPIWFLGSDKGTIIVTIKPDEGYTRNLWPLGNILINLKLLQGFLGGSVVKNLTANAGDTGLIPGPGRFHMQQGNHNYWAWEPQLLSPQTLEPVILN